KTTPISRPFKKLSPSCFGASARYSKPLPADAIFSLSALILTQSSLVITPFSKSTSSTSAKAGTWKPMRKDRLSTLMIASRFTPLRFSLDSGIRSPPTGQLFGSDFWGVQANVAHRPAHSYVSSVVAKALACYRNVNSFVRRALELPTGRLLPTMQVSNSLRCIVFAAAASPEYRINEARRIDPYYCRFFHGHR